MQNYEHSVRLCDNDWVNVWVWANDRLNETATRIWKQSDSQLVSISLYIQHNGMCVREREQKKTQIKNRAENQADCHDWKQWTNEAPPQTNHPLLRPSNNEQQLLPTLPMYGDTAAPYKWPSSSSSELEFHLNQISSLPVQGEVTLTKAWSFHSSQYYVASSHIVSQ